MKKTIYILLVVVLFGCPLNEDDNPEIKETSIRLLNLPQKMTNVTEIDITVKGPIDSYRYKLDGNDESEVKELSEHIVAADLAEGPHTITVTGIKEEGEAPKPVEYEWEIDITPPVAELGGLPFPETTVTLINAVVKDDDAVSYRYAVDGEALSVENDVAVPIRVTGLGRGGHTLSVITRDEAGNWQLEESMTTYTWTILDPGEHPPCDITGIPALTNLTAIDAVVETVTGGGENIVSYRYRVNLNDWSSDIPVGTHIIEENLEDGENMLFVAGKTGTGEWVPEGMLSWVIDTVPPAVSAGPDIAFRDTATVLHGTVTDNIGTDGVCLWSRTGGEGTVVFDTPDELSTTASGLEGEEAEFVLTLTAYDRAGNSASDSLLFRWDLKPPAIDAGKQRVYVGRPLSLAPAPNLIEEKYLEDINGFTCIWTQETGAAGAVAFDDIHDPDTVVQGPEGVEAIYVLRLEATDSMGHSSSDTFNFRWDAENPESASEGKADASAFSASLVWKNPAEDFAGIVAVRTQGETGLPGLSDGTLYERGDVIGDSTVVYFGGESVCTDPPLLEATENPLAPETRYTYTVFVYDKARNYSAPLDISAQTIEAVIYVGTNGDNRFSGYSPSEAKRSIQAGIDFYADKDFKGDVYVAAGTYMETIILKSGVSLLGGFSPDWSERDIDDRENEVFKTRLTNVIAAERRDKAEVVYGENLTAESILEGFVIEHTQDFTAVTMKNSSSIIRHNTISGYICVLNVDSATEVAYNRLIAVEDSNTAGVYNIGSSPVIYNNVIDGGGDELVMANSYGIVNESGSAPVIANNTICAGRGLIGTYGIYLKESPGTVIENNIIFTDDGTYRFGVYVWNTGNPVSLRNNNIFDFVVPYHCGNDGRIIEVTDIHQMNALSGFQVSGNISSPPVFSDREAMDVRITEESGANTRAGGLDLSGYLLDDIDGNPRTGGYGGDASSIRPNNEGAAGWSIGAYECDG